MRYDAVVIGAGVAGATAARALLEKGLKCALIAQGHSTSDPDMKPLVAAGLSLYLGDQVLSGDIQDGNLLALHTQKMEDEPIVASNYILASGKYFSRGIVADMDKVYEPIFGLDVEFDADRSTWIDPDFSHKQKFMSFGVKNYGQGRVAREGFVLSNLFAAGEVLEGITALDSNETIAASALEAVSNIK